MMKIILASRSPRRRFLMKDMGLDFKMVPSDVDESKVEEENPRDLVRKLAMLKAGAVARGLREHVLVLGADTVVYLDGEIMSKPLSRTQAKKFLRKLSGKVHSVFTGICVINTKTGNVMTDVQKTKVRFRQLIEKEIEKTVEFGDVTDFAGGYKIQSHPWLIQSIEGSYTNVVGLPIELLIPMLRENGTDI